MTGTVVLAATHVWWYAARSSGVVAWALCAFAVVWGLALSTRALGRRPPAPWLLDLHRFLGVLAVVFTVVHLVALALDPFVSFGVDELLVPFASSWKPGAVAWGVVALYLLLAVEVTSLLRSRLPNRLWRSVHLSSYVLYAVATVHLLTAGTDRHNAALRGSVLVSVGVVVFFTLYRLVGPGRAASVKGSGAGRTRAASTSASAVAPAGRGSAVVGAHSAADVRPGDRAVRRRAGGEGGTGPRGRPGVALGSEGRGGEPHPDRGRRAAAPARVAGDLAQR